MQVRKSFWAWRFRASRGLGVCGLRVLKVRVPGAFRWCSFRNLSSQKLGSGWAIRGLAFCVPLGSGATGFHSSRVVGFWGSGVLGCWGSGV